MASPAPITFVTAGYMGLLRLWMRQSRPFMPGDPHVYALDGGALAALAAEPGLQAQDARTDAAVLRSRRRFWVHRLGLIEAHARAHGQVLHSDADAFWLASPTAELDAIDADLLVSVEHGLPRAVDQRRGFLGCCGFFLLRWTPRTSHLFELWREAAGRLEDDQIALNLLLPVDPARWRAESDGGRSCELDLGAGPLRVHALSEARYNRRPPFAAGEDAVIAHAYLQPRWRADLIHMLDRLLDAEGSFRPGPAPPPPPGTPGRERDWAALSRLESMGADAPDASDPRLLRLLGAVRLRAGRPEAAARALRRAWALDPALGGGYRLDLSDALRETGDRDGARQALAEALAAPRPDDELPPEVLERALTARSWSVAARAGGACARLAANPGKLGAYASRRRLTARRDREVARALAGTA